MDFIEQINDRAQDAFRTMLRAHDRTGTWAPELVDAYVNAERDLDWERQRAEFDRLQAADHDMHYFEDPTCGECTR